VAAKPSPKQRHDPMIVALIGKLPSDQTPFPLDRRLAWLRMAAMTFDLVYGVEEPITLTGGVPPGDARVGNDALGASAKASVAQTLAVPKDPARLPRPRLPDQMYVIDLDGVAWGRDAPLSLSAIGSDDPIWDFRPGEQGVESVIWSDPANGKIPQLMILKA
jgi:hypothetical protein